MEKRDRQPFAFGPTRRPNDLHQRPDRFAGAEEGIPGYADGTALGSGQRVRLQGLQRTTADVQCGSFYVACRYANRQCGNGGNQRLDQG